MKKGKALRLTALLLALLMAALTACSTAPKEEDAPNADAPKTTNSDPAAPTPGETEPEPEEPTVWDLTGVPENTNFDGWNFNALVYQNQTWGYCELCVEDLKGEVLNDAFFNRNIEVENLLGIKITQDAIPDPWAEPQYFNTSVTAGDRAYAAAWMRQEQSASCAMNDMCLDLNELGYIDFSHPWWDYHCIEDTTMAGKNYLVAGDISIADKEAIWVIYFDKQNLANAQLESPYEIVESGKWTQDKMMELMDAVKQDLDGDGQMGRTDLWGLLTHPENFAASWMAAGERIVRPDQNGIPSAAFETERFVNVWDKTIKLMKSDSCYYESIAFISSGLRDGYTLFATEVIAFLRAYRDNERDFGVIPMPKYDEEQENYNTYVAAGSGLMIAPKTTDDVDRLGAVLEVLGETGREQVLPAYFDVCIKTRDSRDEESGRMLDICFQTRCYDIGMIFDWGGIVSTLEGGIDSCTRVFSAKGKLMKTAMSKAFGVLGIDVPEE